MGVFCCKSTVKSKKLLTTQYVTKRVPDADPQKNPKPGILVTQNPPIPPLNIATINVNVDIDSSSVFFSLPNRSVSEQSELFYSICAQGNSTWLISVLEHFEWEDSELLSRASQELTGNPVPGDYIHALYASLKQFLVSACLGFLELDSANAKFIVQVQAPGPLDLLWVTMISYTGKYYELCEKLVGKLIHREDRGHREVFPLDLYDFSQEEWELDRRSTLWASTEQVQQILVIIQKKLLESPDTTADSVLTECRATMSISKLLVRSTHPSPSAPKNCSNIEYLKSAENLINLNLKSTEQSLLTALKGHLLAQDDPYFFQELLKEYKRFLIILYYSKARLIPCPLVSTI